MIHPSALSPSPMLFTHSKPLVTIPARLSAERPVESLAAPDGSHSELLLHHRLIDAAEREFGRLMVRIEPLLQPLG